jgi:heptaprenyl diphosphate synthase
VGDWLEDTTTSQSLARAESAFLEAATSDDATLTAIATALVSRGGKRLRPTLVLLTGRYGEADGNQLLSCAVAVELLHVASLYHDDLMDRAPTRRGGPSANALWGNGRAVAGGTYLFSRAAMRLDLSPALQSLTAAAVVAICTGQLREVENAFNTTLAEDEHLEVLALKTGTLFELPCRLGAEVSGAPAAHVEALAEYGRNLGLAFQLADDALDLAGQPSRLGKSVGTDLREGVYSLPVLRALQRAPGAQLAALLGPARLGADDITQALELIRASGTIAEVLDLARSYSQRAVAALQPLPDGSPRRSLVNLATYAVARSE